MPKFFATNDSINIDDKKIILDVETSHHISNVLRYKIGDKFYVTGEDMIDYYCEFNSIENNLLVCSILSSKKNESEFPFEVCLYQGIAKGDKMDIIIQKATELGISKIIPVETQNTVVKLNGDDKISKKVDRWNKIAKEAAKQSERGIIPIVESPIKFKDAILKLKNSNSISLICYGREDHYNLKNFFEDKNISKESINNIESISFFIGPEGGWDKKEIEYANENGIVSVTLGERILRTETASTVLLSMLEYNLF